MKKIHQKILITGFIFFVLISTACGLTNRLVDQAEETLFNVETQVAETVAAIVVGEEAEELDSPEEVAVPTSTDEPVGQASISGNLSFPSEFLPPQRVVAFDVNDPDLFYQIEVSTGNTYIIEVPPGTYFVLAYLMDEEVYGFAGAYSQAVLCGLHVECTDQSLIPVAVTAGEAVGGIDPVDWYLPAEQVGLWPGDPNLPPTGTIRGNLGYPSSFIPPLRVVAFNLQSGEYFYVDTQTNQPDYQISDLPPGQYHVVAYVREDDTGYAGGYSYFVPCGLSVECDDHSLIDIFLFPGQVIEGINPVDFYAPPGTTVWPENPTQ